nr:hypothetical protein [Proteus vulgaris]
MNFAEKRKLVELRRDARIENELRREQAYERSMGA